MKKFDTNYKTFLLHMIERTRAEMNQVREERENAYVMHTKRLEKLDKELESMHRLLDEV